MENNSLQIGLSVFKEIASLWRSGGANSYIQYTKTTRVEPITLIDSDVMLSPELHDVLQSVLSQFAGYYLLAVKLITDVGGIKVGRELERLNPNRDPIDNLGTGWMLSAEAYQDKLPSFKNVPSMEDDDVAVSIGKNSLTQLRDLENLSVGKNITVTVTNGEKSQEVPINVRLIAVSVASSRLVHILAKGNELTSGKERFHGWKSGRLELLKDVVLCRDLIAAHRRNLMKDTDGLLTEITSRRRNNNLSSILSGNPSIANSSNILVMSETTAAMLENDIGGKLSDFKLREKIFNQSSLMIMVVIDKEWNRIRFYHQSIPQVTELSPKDLKSSNGKGSGPDLIDMMKMYQMGNAPRL